MQELVLPIALSVYQAEKEYATHTPKQGYLDQKCGTKRNFEVFEPLDFLAEVTQYIPKQGQHQFRMYSWYSHKKMGMRKKQECRDKCSR